MRRIKQPELYSCILGPASWPACTVPHGIGARRARCLRAPCTVHHGLLLHTAMPPHLPGALHHAEYSVPEQRSWRYPMFTTLGRRPAPCRARCAAHPQGPGWRRAPRARPTRLIPAGPPHLARPPPPCPHHPTSQAPAPQPRPGYDTRPRLLTLKLLFNKAEAQEPAHAHPRAQYAQTKRPGGTLYSATLYSAHPRAQSAAQA